MENEEFELEIKNLNKKLDKDFIISEFAKNLAFKFELEEKNKARVKKLIDKYSFPVFIELLIKKHDSKYFDRCYSKNFLPYPNITLSTLLSYVTEVGEICDNIEESSFYSETISYENYYFCWMLGQGTVIMIYDQNKKLMISFE